MCQQHHLFATGNGGFTLVQTAFLVLILGLFMGSTISFLTVKNDAVKQRLTRERMKHIAVLLSDYAGKRGFLPCPSAPNTFVGESRVCGTLAVSRDGIVPYRELGLSQKESLDGYGNPLTYALSNAVTSTGLGSLVERKCRRFLPLTDPWVWFDLLALSNKNYHPMKARFCCQSVPTSNAIQVRVSTVGASVIPTQNGFITLALPTIPEVVVASTTMTTYLAYTLISHGKNGYGSYTIGAASRKPTANATADEIENADANNIYVAKTPEQTTNNGFDDIVLWRTQEQTIAEVNHDTCASP